MSRVYTKYKVVAYTLLSIFWVLGTYTCILQEISESVYNAISTYINIVGEGLLVILALWTIRKRVDMFLIGSFLAISIISSYLNNGGLFFWLNGLRSYIPMLFTVPVIRYLFSTRRRAMLFLRLMDKSIYIFLWLQIPVMIYQCILYGAYDNVGGTLGWMNSGTISTLIYLLSFYLMLRHWDKDKNYLENLKHNWILLMLLFPSMLNETKISLIYIVLYFLFLIPMDKKFLFRLLYLSPVILVAISVGVYLYSSFLNTKYLTDDDDPSNMFSVEWIEEYTFGKETMKTLVLEGYMENMNDVQETDFARGIKFAALPIILDDNPYGWIWGYGIGQFKGGTHVEMTKFASKFEWFIRGTVMQLMMFIIEMGIMGCLWLIIYILVLFRWGKRVGNRNKRLQWFMGIVTAMILTYAPFFTFIQFMILFTYIAFLSSRWRLTELCKPTALLFGEDAAITKKTILSRHP